MPLKALCSTYRNIPCIIILAFLYFAAARFGLSIQSLHGFASLVWLPTGIAIAALLLGGLRLWPAIALGAFFVNFSVGAPAPVALLIAAGNTLEAVVAFLVLQRFGFKDTFSTLRDAYLFVAVAACAPAISALIGTSALAIGHFILPGEFAGTALIWMIGDIVGALIVVPTALTWVRRPVKYRTVAQYLEGAFVLSVTAVISVVYFWMSSPDLPRVTYTLFIPLGWAAMRTGLRGTTLALMTMSVIALSGTFYGRGLVSDLAPDVGILWTQLFIAVAWAVFIILATVAEERKDSIARLAGSIVELESALKKIRGEDRAKSDFISVLAHELRNPLAPILSSLEMMDLDKNVSQTAAGGYIDTIRHNIRSMSHILDDLLDIARISKRNYRLERTIVALQAIVEKAVGDVSSFMKLHEHTLSVSMPHEPIYLNADPVRLEQVIVNVLNNAAKYTEPGGSIHISAIKKQKMAILTIRDNGIGLEKEEFEKIFEPFLRATDHRYAAGLGIGLSITKRLVEMHGGTIIASSPGKHQGSEFVIELPLTDKIPELAPAENAPAPINDQGRRILIVDDNKLAAEGLGRLLKHFGHETSLAFDGTEALTASESFHPDVAILDIGLPDMSGYDVARTMQKSGYRGTLIALTGYGQDEDKIKARDAGFHYHLTKPVGINDLNRILGSIAHEKNGKTVLARQETLGSIHQSSWKR